MVRKLLLVSLFALAVVSAGCMMPATTTIMAPVMQTKGPLLVGDSAVGIDKVGVSQCEGIILFAFGDASIEAAMKDKGITRIHHVDTEELNILGLYCRKITRVYGE